MERSARLRLFFASVAAVLVWTAAPDLHAAPRLLVVLLLVVLPLLLVSQAAMLEALRQAGELPPASSMYASSAVALWVLALLVAIAARLAGFDAAELFVVAMPPARLAIWSLGLTGGAFALVGVAYVLGARENPLLRHLLPRTTGEKVAFAGLSVTAGVCEEFVYRGFLVAALTIATGSVTLAVLLSAGAFGLVHAYQEPSGAVRAALLGLFFTAPVLLEGSILPAVIAHTAYDIIAGIWLGPRLARGG
jgi:uncharacterized protein